MSEPLDVISEEHAQTLPGLFTERLRRSADKLAYQYFNQNSQQWLSLTWAEVDQHICRWQTSLARHALQPGERVGIMLRNCPEWVFFEQAALRLGLVLVPLYPNDRPDNVGHIIAEAGITVLLFESHEHLEVINNACRELATRPFLISMAPVRDQQTNLQTVSQWLANTTECITPYPSGSDDLATIVYTSGTTGLPKGVMLSHRNILSNARAGVAAQPVYSSDRFLSFLPLSHTLERTVGLYIPMLCGASVAFCRSIPDLAEDLLSRQPTIIISVPRIFEKVYTKIKTQLDEKPAIAKQLFNTAVSIGWQRFLHQQGLRGYSPKLLLWPLLNHLVAKKIIQKLGGNIRFAICGGAPLPEEIGKTFIGLGLPILQGYGLTEFSPVISVNQIHANRPASIGHALPGVEVRLAEDGELLARNDSVMLGYWNKPQATADTITEDGWLNTGDLARMDDEGYIYITGRKKEILVLSNGEKVPPVDMEMAITLDPLFEQAMVIGEARPYLTAVVVLNSEMWNRYCRQQNLNPDKSSLRDKQVCSKLQKYLDKTLHGFPGYAHIRQVHFTLETWTDENGLLTAALKMRRSKLLDYYAEEIAKLYE